jgi:hypothetical protein
VSEENIRESLVHESIFNLIHQESAIKVDCIIRKTSEYRQLEFERRQRISIFDFTTSIVSKRSNHLKTFLGERFAFRDLTGDVRNLLATGYDAAYLQRWTRELGLDILLKECLK